MTDNKLPMIPPDSPWADWAITIGKALADAGLSFVPGGGIIAAGVDVLARIVQKPIEKRQKLWIASLAVQLEELRETVPELTPENLSKNEAFTTAFLHASQIALRTHQQEKPAALRNAVLNAALSTDLDDNMQLTFMHYIDTLTTWHIELLDCIFDPLSWSAKRNYPVHDTHNIDASAIFEATHRGIIPPGYHQTLLQDLYVRGLAANNVNPFGRLYPYSEEDTIPHITEPGRQFLSFIAAPISELEDDAGSRHSQPSHASEQGA